MENPDKVNDITVIIRAVTRSLGLLIPLTAVCVGIFTITDIQDTLVGGVIGILGTAGIFYFEGKS
jgi:hypothetical protein